MGNGFDSPEDFARLLRGMVADTHKASAVAPIRFPDPQGAFPGDIMLRSPPVVVDANVLRNDILRACRTGQRTVLVTAANAGLLRLFCAEHVYLEVIEHSGDWTATGAVTRDAFLRRWLLEYLPLIRVVPIGEGYLAWLDPAELARIRRLAQPGQDPDDVPSAVLALLLEAFFLSEDAKPLRAVYGDADLSRHREWVSILKAGGDAGEFGKTFTLAVNLTALAGHRAGRRRPARRRRHQPVALVAAGLGAAWWYLKRPASTRQRVASMAESVLTCVLGAAIAYQEVQDQFISAAPKNPGLGIPGRRSPARRGPRARLPAHAGPQPRLRSVRCRAGRGTTLPGRRAGRGQGPPGSPRRRPVHRGLAGQVAGRARRPGAAALPQQARRPGGSRLTPAGTSCRPDPEDHHGRPCPVPADRGRAARRARGEHAAAAPATRPWPGNWASPGACTARCTVSPARRCCWPITAWARKASCSTG